MKKILVTTLAVCALVAGAMAQGQITFSASGTADPGALFYTMDGKLTSKVKIPAGGLIPGVGQVNIALYGAAVGTTLSLTPAGFPDLSAWKIGSPILQAVGPAAGGMTGKIVTMDASLGAAGGNVQLEVVAWTGAATSWADAIANPGANLFAWSGDKLSGGALGWTSGSGSATTPFVIGKGPGAFNGLVLAPIPEPSTFALAGLGAAALLIFRRRK
jgi:hypothetical protein